MHLFLQFLCTSEYFIFQKGNVVKNKINMYNNFLKTLFYKQSYIYYEIEKMYRDFP